MNTKNLIMRVAAMILPGILTMACVMAEATPKRAAIRNTSSANRCKANMADRG
jgi:hypothetical protein